MALRYEEADKDAVRIMEEVRAKHFPSIGRARIKLLFDLRRRKGAGGLILGKISKPNDMVRFFSRKDASAIQGYDYIISVDKVAWGAAGETDRVRLIRHELRHADYDIEAKDPYRLIKHDVNDFRAEIELNTDDPTWGDRLAVIAIDIYAQQAEDKQDHPNQASLPGTGEPGATGGRTRRSGRKSGKDAAAGGD